MKSSYAALAVVGLALAGLWYAGGGAAVPPQSAAAAEQPRVSAPLAHDNLTVYFVHGPDAVGDTHKVATLQEALDAGWAVVHETGDVNALAVENRSADTELFIQEGDIIKGGRQDRVIATDMLVPPKSGAVPFPAHCVEQGRWTGRGGEAATHFNKSDQFAVGNELRYANATYDQGKVWENVKKNQEQLSANLNVRVNAPESESSLQLALENKAVQGRVAEFEQALRAAGESRRNVIGVVFVVNGQVTGAEVYGSNALFLKAWPKLLRSNAASAVAEKTAKPTPPAPPVVEVERMLALAGQQPAPTGRAENAGDLVNIITDGTSNRAAFAGRGRGVGSGSVSGSGGGRGWNDLTGAVNPTAAAPDSSIMGGNGSTRVDERQLRQLAETWGSLEPARRQRIAEDIMRDAPARYRSVLGEYFRSLDRIHPAVPPAVPAPEIVQSEGRPPRGAEQTEGRSPAAVNPDGNRLSVNRVEDGAGLVTESRDPARRNAVIHRSLIKK